MPVSLGTNIASLVAQRQLSSASNAYASSLQRLSSGQRINQPADDAAGLAVATGLKSNARVFTQGIRNLNDGISLLGVADQAVETLTNIVTRQRELATQAANGTYTIQQRQAMDQEAQQLSKEYFRIARDTEFNGMKLFDGSLGQLNLQAGYGTQGSIPVTLGGKMGDGTFKDPEWYAADNVGYKALKLADFNNDGIADLATGETYSNSVSVLLGNGDGTFRAKEASSAPTWVNQVAVGDFNGDGNQDMVAGGWILSGAQNITDQVYVYLGNGDGTFRAYVSYAPGMSPSGISATDLNGDGYEDLVVGIYNQGGAGSIQVMMANSDGTFSIGESYSTAWAASDTAIGDLDNDGKIDVVAWAWQTSQLSVFKGKGDGTFENAVFYDNGPAAGFGILSDVNDDGFLDALAFNGAAYIAGTDYSVMLGNGDGSFRAQMTFRQELIGGYGNGPQVAADLDGDGKKEVVLITSDQQALEIHKGNGDGTFKIQQAPQSPVSLPDWSMSAISGDLNSDNVTDIIWAGGSLWVSLGNTRDGIGPQPEFSIGTRNSARLAVTQFSGNLDILALQRGTIGAAQSRVSAAVSMLEAMRDNHIEASARITDVDVAAETAKLVGAKVRRNAATAILAQANQQPNIVMRLLS